MPAFTGKIALITGGAGGIGSETARLFAEMGAKGIVIADYNRAQGEEVAASIERETGAKCLFVQVDIGKGADIDRLFEEIQAQFGELHALVNCAGVCPVISIDDVDEKEWHRVMDINLTGAYLCCRRAFQMMREQKYGKIVNVSSISGRIGAIATGINYASSKGGMMAMTMTLAKNAGPLGINVNAVAPGYIDTEMTRGFSHFDPQTVPMRRIGKPRDVAEVIAFLCEDRSSYITGVTLDINGGVFMVG